jgi:hypothetical protein
MEAAGCHPVVARLPVFFRSLIRPLAVPIAQVDAHTGAHRGAEDSGGHER